MNLHLGEVSRYMEETQPGDPPTIPEDLLKWLEARLPPYTPKIDTPDRKIWFECGRRQVIEWLRQLFETQRNRP